MPTYTFKLPDVGEGTAEAEIVAWHADVGDEVEEGTPLVDVMTEKATVEIDAPVTGRITARHGAVGDMAPVGSPLVVFETEGTADTPPPAPQPERPPTPAAPPPAAPPPPKPAPTLRPSAGIEASPAVRARAKALGIDLAAVAGSGPGGRIEHADLDARLTAAIRPSAGVEEIKIVGLRRKIAERMQETKRRIPHFSYVEEVDVTAVEELRRHLNDEAGPDGRKLTLLPFVARAVVRALARHPGLNALFDDEAGMVRRHAAVHLGVATQTPGGLMVPVVRHAEALDLDGLAAAIAQLAAAARDGKASREDLTGSTITISSLGPLGGIAATPILNAPEVAIVGVNRAAERPVVRQGRIEVRRMMNLSSSFDHRIVDGWDAAAFIQTVKALLEQPATLFMER